MFVDCRTRKYTTAKHVNGIEINGGEIYAIISSLTWNKPSKVGVSRLFYKGKLDRQNNSLTYYAIPASSIDSTAVVIYDVIGNSLQKSDDEVLVVTPCEEWAYKFENLYDIS